MFDALLLHTSYFYLQQQHPPITKASTPLLIYHVWCPAFGEGGGAFYNNFGKCKGGGGRSGTGYAIRNGEGVGGGGGGAVLFLRTLENVRVGGCKG